MYSLTDMSITDQLQRTGRLFNKARLAYTSDILKEYTYDVDASISVYPKLLRYEIINAMKQE